MRNKYLNVGDYIITSSSIVGRIVSINNDSIELQHYDQIEINLSINEYPLCSQMNLTEVVETTNIISLNINSVIRFCYIFHIDDVESGTRSISGMSDGYFIRYCKKTTTKDDEDTLSLITYNDWKPFSSKSGIYYQYYFFITQVQSSFKEGLNPTKRIEYRKIFRQSFPIPNIDIW